ncbi:Membrin-11 [Citrus sinensis]|uniref:Membrin-11 n=1 Tax=Citrus sinensis TaxID=2711 RepID=A0ACB8MHD3_CITSI|nr:Membrin-11 [Citrus sinensis]
MAMAVEGGGTLSEIYQSAKKLLLRARDGVEKLERLESSTSTGGYDSPELSFAVKKDISQIQSLCVEMDRLWRSIADKSQRDLWKRHVYIWKYINSCSCCCLLEVVGIFAFGTKCAWCGFAIKVEQVAEEAESLKESLDKYFLRNQRRINEARERAELLGRANGESSHILRIFDEEAQAMQSVRNSSRMLQESFATGTAILAKYAEQREHLKKAQRKALDVLNTVGLSNSVLRLIERRNRVDTWIKYVGMVSTVVILYFFWRWTRTQKRPDCGRLNPELCSGFAVIEGHAWENNMVK